MKRVITYLLLIVLLVNIGVFPAFADTSKAHQDKSRKIMVYFDPDITVKYNNVTQTFRDAAGNPTSPIIYNGFPYLTVRAVSDMMNESVDWDPGSKTIFIGKTLSDPENDKTTYTNTNSNSNTNIITSGNSQDQMVQAYLKPDILIMYDFELQTFLDSDGKQANPIVYKGNTYLPAFAVSQMLKEPIEWDGTTNTISIGNGKETGTTDKKELGITAKLLKNLFEQEEILYYEATAKTTAIRGASPEERQIIAEVSSENYRRAQDLTQLIKSIDTADYTTEELAAHEKICEFAESTEYYILILENISYLAACGEDYSMLAETFLYFALDSQNKMREARELVGVTIK